MLLLFYLYVAAYLFLNYCSNGDIISDRYLERLRMLFVIYNSVEASGNILIYIDNRRYVS